MFFDFTARCASGTPRFRWYWLEDHNPLSGNRKRRRIYNPNQPMRELHGQLIRYLRGLHVDRASSTGARPGSSPLRNVLRHKPRWTSWFPRFFFLIDISGAYANVDGEKLVKIILDHDQNLAGRELDVRAFLSQYCMSTEEGGLIVGAPASPDLFNLYCEVLIDGEIRSLCRKYGLTYTRYLDDLTFSSSQRIGKKKRQALCAVIERAGFKLNQRKARVLDLAKGPVAINGVGITRDGRCFLPRQAVRELRGLLHLALSGRLDRLSTIHGRMGVFKALTNLRFPTKTERRVLDMYRQLKKLS